MESKFKQLEQELEPFNNLMSQAADAILDQDISSYPIFVIHQQDEITIGIPIMVPEDGKANWSIHASSLEELATKKIINSNRIDNFRQVYKDPMDFLCLFVLTLEEATFVFLPRKG